MVGGCQHDDDQIREIRLVTNPVEHFESRNSWQTEIEQDQEWDWKAAAIRVRAISREILQRHSPVFYFHERISDARAAEGALHQLNVRLIVFDQKND